MRALLVMAILLVLAGQAAAQPQFLGPGKNPVLDSVTIGGWRLAVSGGKFTLYDPSGNAIREDTAGAGGGSTMRRIAVGASGSALPATAGGIKHYGTWNGQNAVVVDWSGFTGTADANDYFLYNSALDNWKPYGSFATGSITAGLINSPKYGSYASGVIDFYHPANIIASKIDLPGSAAPSAPTTGVRVWAGLTSGSPTLALLGAAGKTPNITVPGTTFAAKGSATGTGYGIAVGVASAASIPTTHAVDLARGADTPGPAGMLRMQQYSLGAVQFRHASGTGGGAAIQTYSIVLANAGGQFTGVKNYAGTGAPTLTYGATVPAGYGVTFVGGSKPAAPAAGSVILHGGLEAGVAVLSVEKSGATTHIVTIVP
jgi:hypothetical protein